MGYGRLAISAFLALLFSGASLAQSVAASMCPYQTLAASGYGCDTSAKGCQAPTTWAMFKVNDASHAPSIAVTICNETGACRGNSIYNADTGAILGPNGQAEGQVSADCNTVTWTNGGKWLKGSALGS